MAATKIHFEEQWLVEGTKQGRQADKAGRHKRCCSVLPTFPLKFFCRFKATPIAPSTIIWTFWPKAVPIKSFKNCLCKGCSTLAPKMLTKLTLLKCSQRRPQDTVGDGPLSRNGVSSHDGSAVGHLIDYSPPGNMKKGAMLQNVLRLMIKLVCLTLTNNFILWPVL